MQKDKDERNVASLFCILLRCWNFMTLQKRKALQDLVIYSMVTIAFNSVVLGGKFGNEGGKPNMVFALNSLLRYPVPSRSPIRTGARLISLFLLHFLPSTYLLLPPSILPNSVPLPPPPLPLFSGRWEFSTPFFALVHPCRRRPHPLRKLPKAQLPQLSLPNLSQAGHPKIANAIIS